MLSATKFKKLCQRRKVSVEQLSGHLVRGGLNSKEATAAVRNWQKGLFKPKPRKEDVQHLATALGVEVNELGDWC